jgi:hypothetical protein
MVHALGLRNNGEGKVETSVWKVGWRERDPRFFLELGKRHSLLGWTGNRIATPKKRFSLQNSKSCSRERERLR